LPGELNSLQPPLAEQSLQPSKSARVTQNMLLVKRNENRPMLLFVTSFLLGY
jgi:hypothetical protein